MNLRLVKLQLLVCGLLSLILAAEWAYGEFAARRLQQSQQYSIDDSKIPAELPTIPTLKSTTMLYNELVERPLFIEGRKPIVEESVEKVQNNVENGLIDDWALIGIYKKDKRPMALFARKNETKKFLKISNEQMISGWLLKEIQSDRVILQQAAQQKTVLLRKPREENRPPAPLPLKPAIPPKHPRPAEQPLSENANDDSQKN